MFSSLSLKITLVTAQEHIRLHGAPGSGETIKALRSWKWMPGPSAAVATAEDIYKPDT